MSPRRSLDPNLFDRADRAQRAASGLLDRARASLAKVSAPVSDRAIQDMANAEAKRAVDSGLGSISLTQHDLTPGMGRIASDILAQYSSWKSDLEKHASAVDSAKADIDQEIDDIQGRDIPELNVDRASALSQVDQDLETSKSYVQNREQYAAEKGRFEKLRGYNKGIFPKNINRLLYWFSLFVIGIGDMIVNYSVFLSKFEVALAIIATLIIAFVVAVTSHVHGKFFRQRKLLYSLESDEVDRKAIRRELWIVTVFFIGCLIFIFWARYTYFAAGAGLDYASNGLLSFQFILSRIGPTLFFNIVVWFVGALIAFFAHERVPGLREAYVTWKNLDSELEDMRERSNSEKASIEKIYDNEMIALENRSSECRARATALGSMRDQLRNLDHGYKNQLASASSAVMKRYAGILCAQIVKLEGDASAMVFTSARRGRLSMSDFEASDFLIGL